MHQNAFGGQAPPGPVGAAYSTPPDLLAGFKGRDGKGRKRRQKGRERKKKGREGKENGGGREKDLAPRNTILAPP